MVRNETKVWGSLGMRRGAKIAFLVVTPVVLLSLGFYVYLDLRRRTVWLEEKLQVVLTVRRIEHDSKEIAVHGTEKYLQVWIEQWQNGEMISSTRSGLLGGAGPLDFPVRTRVHAAAVEDPRGSGRLRIVLRFPDVALSATQYIEIGPFLETPDWWSMKFLAGNTVLATGEGTPLLAVWPDSSVVPTELDVQRLRSLARERPWWILKIGLTEKG